MFSRTKNPTPQRAEDHVTLFPKWSPVFELSQDYYNISEHELKMDHREDIRERTKFWERINAEVNGYRTERSDKPVRLRHELDEFYKTRITDEL